MLRGLIAGAIALLVVGVVLLVATDGATPTGVGFGLIGCAAVLALSAVFYLVGRSEERDRARRPRG